MMLYKIRRLPEAKRKLIFWITVVVTGLAMIIWFVLTTIARIKTLVS